VADSGVWAVSRVTIGSHRYWLAAEVVSMAVSLRADDERVTAVCAALAPFAWRSFTPESLGRRALAAMDAGQVSRRIDPHGLPEEECVAAVVEFLRGRPWRSYTVVGLSRLLVGAALAWREDRDWFDIRLGLLLDGVG